MQRVTDRDPRSEVLDSWKEIAAYRGRDVSTAQRWEHSRALPVRRIQGGKRGAVYALKSELDAWRYQTRAGEEEEGKPVGPWPPADARGAARRATGYRIAAALAVAGALAVLYWSLIFRSSTAALRFVPLASLPGDELDPAFSPDGRFVAFSYQPEGGSNFDLYVKAVGAGEPLRLTNTPETERYPQWSPDSSQLAFLRKSNPGLGVWVMGALGGGERRIAVVSWSRGYGEPGLAWSGTGDSLIVPDREDGQSPPPFTRSICQRDPGDASPMHRRAPSGTPIRCVPRLGSSWRSYARARPR